MKYRNAAIIFLAGVACATLGIWLLGGISIPKVSISNDMAIEEGDTSIQTPTQEKPTYQATKASVRRQPTPTRTQLLAHQMALRSGRHPELHQKFYEEILPKLARFCSDAEGMSDVVNLLVRSHERILDLGLELPKSQRGLSENLYSIISEMAPRSQGDLPCKRVADIYIELRGQGQYPRSVTDSMLGVIRKQ